MILPTFDRFLTAYLRQRPRNLTKASQPRFNIIDNIRRYVVWLRQIVQVGQRFVFQPENIQAGFIAGDDLLITEFTPAAFGVFLIVPDFLALMRFSGL